MPRWYGLKILLGEFNLWKELINQRKTTRTKFMVLEQKWEQKAEETFSLEEEIKVANNLSENNYFKECYAKQGQ